MHRRLSLAQKQKCKLQREKNSLKTGLKHFLAEDQLKCLEKSTMRGTSWSRGTLEKAIKIRLSCGSRGFNVVRDLGQPLPAERTLQRHLQDFKFMPGVLHELMDSLAYKVSQFSKLTLMITNVKVTVETRARVNSIDISVTTLALMETFKATCAIHFFFCVITNFLCHSTLIV